MYATKPTLRLNMSKPGDQIKLSDGDARIFTVGEPCAWLEGYIVLHYRGKIIKASKSEPIKMIASALDTLSAVE